jgi:hypothetical protein
MQHPAEAKIDACGIGSQETRTPFHQHPARDAAHRLDGRRSGPIEVMRQVIGRMHVPQVTICYGMTALSWFRARPKRMVWSAACPNASRASKPSFTCLATSCDVAAG